MNESLNTPTPDEQIDTAGHIHEVPGAEHRQSDSAPEPADETYHGGYTGVRVGQMANQIEQLRAMGKHKEADALTEELNKVSPPSETEK